MVKIDLKRIKNMRFIGTYLLTSESAGGDLPEGIDILGKTVSMYSDFELEPTTHFIIDVECRMYMRHYSGGYSDWEEFETS